MSNPTSVCSNSHFLNLNGDDKLPILFCPHFVANGSERLTCKGVFKCTCLKERDFIIAVGYCVTIHISWKGTFKFLNTQVQFFSRMTAKSDLDMATNSLIFKMCDNL